MRYVMSDIHSCYDEFIKMLKLIKFNAKDELYIIGDIWDRGPKPLQVLDYILAHKNIHLIKGNHEEMVLEYLDSNDTYLWLYNGGESTFNELTKRGEDYMYSLLDYLKKLPTYKVIDNYILVHAGMHIPSYNCSLDEILNFHDEEYHLWGRNHIGKENKHEKYIIICGHTPVQTIQPNCNTIIKKDNYIYIDCGCVFKRAHGRLACLRLHDMEEFYIE